MKHQYRTEKGWKKDLQIAVDLFVDLYAKLFIKKNVSEHFIEPQNILIISLGHLGDALSISYIFPIIHEQFPNANIDVLTGEWCKPILLNNPFIRELIFFNHLRMDRSKNSYWKKIFNHIKTSRYSQAKIRSGNYDLSIEGRISHPNGNLLTYRGKIKRRIGFGSGGFGALLTDEVFITSNQNFHMLDAILDELKIIGIFKSLQNVKPYFNVSDNSLAGIKESSNYLKEPFVILHTETGKDYLPTRLINGKFWLEIVRLVLTNTEFNIIVSGTNQKSSDFFEFLLSNFDGAKRRIVSAINKFSLDEFFLLSQDAIMSITVDSLAAHFCAINCNTISFYKNGFGALFFPISNKKAIVIHNHKPSKDIVIHSNTTTHYVNEIESEETFSIVLDLLKKQ